MKGSEFKKSLLINYYDDTPVKKTKEYKNNEDTIVSHMLLIKFADIVDNVIVVEENIKNKEMDVKVYAEDGYFSGYLDSSTDSALFRSLVTDIFCNSF